MTKMIIIVTLMGLGFLALSFFQAYSQFVGLSPMGLSKIVLFNGFLISFVISILVAVMKITATHTFSDADLLLSMPIKKSTIALVKTISKYLFNFALIFFLLVPYFTLYMVYEGFSLYTLFMSLLILILFPIFSFVF